MSDEPCERHPDCLFQGGCDCKRRAMTLDPRYTQLPDGSPGRPARIPCAENGCSLPLWHAGDHAGPCCEDCEDDVHRPMCPRWEP